MNRLLILLVLLAGCSDPLVHGTVTHKRIVHRRVTTEMRPVGGYLFPFDTEQRGTWYELGVKGRSLGGESSVDWIEVDKEEYEDTRIGDKWQDGWHVAKTHK